MHQAQDKSQCQLSDVKNQNIKDFLDKKIVKSQEVYTSQVWSQEETKQFFKSYVEYDYDLSKIPNLKGIQTIKQLSKFLPQQDDIVQKVNSYCLDLLAEKERQQAKLNPEKYESFFLKNIFPLVKDGYQGLSSLVEGIPQQKPKKRRSKIAKPK